MTQDQSHRHNYLGEGYNGNQEAREYALGGLFSITKQQKMAKFPPSGQRHRNALGLGFHWFVKKGPRVFDQ